MIPSPKACPCCWGKLTRLGEDVTETLEVAPRSWNMVQAMRERLVCRASETITQARVPLHPISRGQAGSELLANTLEA